MFKGKKRSDRARPTPDNKEASPLTAWLGDSASTGNADGASPEPIAGEGNKAPRVIACGIIDRSGSVQDHAGAIDRGQLDMVKTLAGHNVASWSVELALGFIGHPPHVEPFQPVRGFALPAVSITGSSPYGTTLDLAINEIVRRTNALSAAGIETHKVIAAVIGDGRPNSESPELTARALERWRSLQGKGSLGLVCFPICVGNADHEFMAKLSLTNKPKALRDFDFKSLFYWLSQALISVSVSQPGEAVQLPPTDSWSA